MSRCAGCMRQLTERNYGGWYEGPLGRVDRYCRRCFEKKENTLDLSDPSVLFGIAAVGGLLVIGVAYVAVQFGYR